MNWYGKNIICPHKKSAVKKSLTKTSASNKSVDNYFKDNSRNDSDNQVGHNMTMFDVQQYVMDSYNIKVAFSKTKSKFAITFLCNHGFLGSIAWDFYWYYDLNEFKEAKSTYEAVIKKTKEVISDFVENQRPTPMFWVYMKKHIGGIDPGAARHTNIPVVNYFHKYNRDHISEDWTSNIYGGRLREGASNEISMKNYDKIYDNIYRR